LNKIVFFTKDTIQRLFRFFNYKICKIGPYSSFDFESFLYRYLAVHKKIHFIQIGANDGVMNDPLYQFNIKNKSVVSGYVLEPLPDIFEKLSQNYKKMPNISPVNLAIHADKAEMTLYRVKPHLLSKIPVFAEGIASFDKNHWKKTNIIPNNDYIEEVLVTCIPIQTFIDLNKIQVLDLLVLDTEGYDYQILMDFNFNRIKPKIIRFEHGLRNGIMDKDNFIKLCKYLNLFGYQIYLESYDATAYLLDPLDTMFD